VLRKLGRRAFWAFVALAVVSVAGAAEAPKRLRELPPMLRAVSDEPGVLSLAEGQALSRRIAEIERATGVKLVALVVVTVAPESVEAYVQRLIDHWKRHSHALDNGRFVFVVIAKNDREIRIVPGPDLAWVLKSLSGGAMADTVPKLLRTDQYYEALLTIVNRLSQLIADRIEARAAGQGWPGCGFANRPRAVRIEGAPEESYHGSRMEQGQA
jgi:uncharacterized protein